MLQRGPRPYSGKHRALCMVGSRMGASDPCFTRQSILESTRVATWSRTVGVPTNGTFDFVSAPWCMLATPTPHRHRRACFFIRHQVGWLSKRTRRSKLNTRHPLLSNVTSLCWHEGLRNLVCQLQRLTSCWQPHLRYPEFP